MQNHFEPSDQMANSRNASFPNVTDTFAGEADLPFFPSGLGFLDAASHLITHPKIKDWLQLLLLGLAAELARRIGTKLCVWARYVFCITSSHYMNDEAYDWLTAYWMHDPTWQERGRRLLTDSKLNQCMTSVPAGSVVVMEDIDVSMPEGSSTLNRQGDDETDDEDEDNDSEGSSKRKDSANRSVTRGSAVTLSGLLNAIDGVAGSEGRILFMTTNHIEKLDPALIRPGRADIRVEFKNANKSMCRDLFKVFYPVTGEYPVKYARASDVRPSVSACNEKGTQLTERDIDLLADEFAQALPEREFSPAQIQGMLMMHRVYPGEALDAIPTWIEAKRKEKADEERKKEQVAETKTSKEEEGTTKNGADKKAKEDVTGVQEVLTVAVETKHSPAS